MSDVQNVQGVQDVQSVQAEVPTVASITTSPTPAAPAPKFKSITTPLHHHLGFWILITLLGIAVVVLGIILSMSIQTRSRLNTVVGQLQGRSGQLATTLEEAQTQINALEGAVSPIAYEKLVIQKNEGVDFQSPEIHVKDLVTGEDRVVLTRDYELLAVPRQGFDGRIFVRSYPVDGPDYGGKPVYSLDVQAASAVPTEAIKADQLPMQFDAQVLSPDETKILALYDAGGGVRTEVPRKSVAVWNLLTGKYQLIGKVANDEYLSLENGESVFGWASGFNALWNGLDCVLVGVFQDRQPKEGETNFNADRKQFKELREFCME